MRAENGFRPVDVWVGVRDPGPARKVEHDLVELLLVAACAVLVGAETFVEIEAWANEKQDGLRQYLKLEQGIASHDSSFSITGGAAHAARWRMRSARGGTLPALLRRSVR